MLSVKEMEENKRFSKVVKANELITKSRFSLTLQQQKIILYLISQINPFDDEFKLYEFSIREFCQICGIETDSGKNYEMLKEQIKKIADKSLWIKLRNGKETLLRWIEKPYIDENSGIIQIRLDNDMKPYLLQLTGNFTEYELIYALHFKSKYTIRLYELIKAIHFHSLESYTKEFSLDELKRLLDAENYTQFKDFHSRVLKPAVAEINLYSDKILSYELIKKSRTVIAVVFTIESKDTLASLQVVVNIEKEFDGQLTIFD